MGSPKVAVIGASGLVGSALTRVLESHHYEVSGTYANRPVDGLTHLDITERIGPGFCRCRSENLQHQPSSS